jgi:hypothetical protein
MRATTTAAARRGEMLLAMSRGVVPRGTSRWSRREAGFYDSFDKDELLEVITGLIVISSDIPLLLPCFCTDLGFVNTENG